MSGHDWNLSWPGNTCKRCFADDPAEQCIADCKQAPLDEDGYPNPSECPVHGIDSGLWECPAGNLDFGTRLL
jgi:hypothetical protein